MNKLILVGLILIGTLGLYWSVPAAKTDQERVTEIYDKIVSETGQSGTIPDIKVVENDQVNAYANPDEIVVYTGLLKKIKNDDELALIIGHEVSHVTLGHVYVSEEQATKDVVLIMESHADKMGAYYMMRAGYDICVGREFWKRKKAEAGDYIGFDHPDMAYRYDQLNVNCGE